MSTREHFLTSAFKRLIKNGGLGHGYLIFGEDLIAQRDFAKSLLGFLETKKWLNPSLSEGSPVPQSGISAKSESDRPTRADGFRGDMVWIDGMYVTKDEKGTIGIDTIREAIKFLWATPLVSPRKTLVIEDADGMAHEAQQALLKTAEEPPRNGLLLLLVRNPESLFGTLTSRLQKIYVPRIMNHESRIKNESELNERAREYVTEFLGSDNWNRSKVLKALFDEEDNALVDAFSDELFFFLSKNPVENWEALRELLKRMTAMAQFNTNRKLQFEAVIPFLQ